MRAARAGAECASMSTSRSWMSAMRCGSVRGLRLGQQRARARCRRRARPRAGSRARPAPPAPPSRCAAARGMLIAAVVRRELAGDERNSVVLPEPLRPTKPTLCPRECPRSPCRRARAPSMRKVRSLMCSMAGFSQRAGSGASPQKSLRSLHHVDRRTSHEPAGADFIQRPNGGGNHVVFRLGHPEVAEPAHEVSPGVVDLGEPERKATTVPTSVCPLTTNQPPRAKCP